jgi:hypothetical protein
MGTSDFDRDAACDDAIAAVGILSDRNLARRKGLVESYVAQWHWHGGCLDPGGMARIRVNRYRVRATIKGEVFDKWQDTTREVKRRVLTGADWQRVVEWIDAAGFWQLPSRHTPSSGGFHGESWMVEGFRDGRFHFVRRASWSVPEGIGAEISRLGKCMGHLAGLSVFEET